MLKPAIHAAAMTLGLWFSTAAPPNVAAQEPSSGTLVVTNKGANTASIIDVASGRIVATIPVGRGPHEVAMSYDGRLAIATNYGDQTANNSLTLIDVAAGRALKTIDLGRYSRPHGAHFLPGDSLVSVTSETTGNVILVRIPDGNIAAAIPTNQGGSHMVTVMAPDGRAYTSNGRSGSITELNLLNRTTGRITEVAPRVEAIQINPSGSEVWVGSNELGTVTVISAMNGEVRGTLTGFTWPYRVAFTPDGSRALIPDLTGHDLRVFDTGDLDEIFDLPLPGAGPEGIIAVNDNTAYLSLSAQDVVAVVDLTDGSIIRRIPTGSRPDGIGYSPLVTRGGSE